MSKTTLLDWLSGGTLPLEPVEQSETYLAAGRVSGNIATTAVTRPTPGEWDFEEQGTGDHISSLHPYPARFIPAIPRHAIAKYLRNPGCVWDPFAGSGTALIEANAAGHQAFGCDVNHLALLLQQVYTTPLTHSDLDDAARLLANIEGLRPLSESRVLRDYAAIPRLQHWFSSGAIVAIGSYLDAMSALTLTTPAERVAKFALSRVVVRISRQESDTQYRAVKAPIEVRHALSQIRASLRDVLRELPRYHRRASSPAVRSVLGDARDPATYDCVPQPDLVVTSPPYPNAYEYWLYHKYRMFWLDMDPIWSRTREIGARPFYSGTGKLGREDFAADMRAVLSNITRHAKPSTTQVWVTGDGIVKGELLPTAEIIREEAADLGWHVVEHATRSLSRQRSSFQGIGRLKHEDVLILRRERAA